MYYLIESSQRPCEGGAIIIPISQVSKLRPERRNNLPKVTGCQVAQPELQGTLEAAALLLITELLPPTDQCPPPQERTFLLTTRHPSQEDLTTRESMSTERHIKEGNSKLLDVHSSKQ